METVRLNGQTYSTWPGERIVPVEEILEKLPPCKPRVRERVTRLNADGCPEGCHIRGWHRNDGPRSPCRDTCGRRELEARWGKGSYGKLPKWMLRKIGGKRRAVPGILLLQGPPWLSQDTYFPVPWLEKAARR